METRRFSDYSRSTVYSLLIDAYSASPEITNHYRDDWKVFDAFVYDNLPVMDHCGFISVEGSRPVWFISWDPRNLPDSVEMGYNCILRECQGSGRGSKPLRRAIRTIQQQKPGRILLKNGKCRFFCFGTTDVPSGGFSTGQG
jgi:hypothetical protein